MKKRSLFLMICLIMACLPIFECGLADIPVGVKNEYRYNEHDESIIAVKERLQQLGYFNDKARFSDFVSNDLKKAVISFQRQNGMETDGEIDSVFLRKLFSDDVIDAMGIRRSVLSDSEENSNESGHSAYLVRQGINDSDNRKSDSGIGALGDAVISICLLVFAIILFSGVRRRKNRRKRLESLNDLNESETIPIKTHSETAIVEEKSNNTKSKTEESEQQAPKTTSLPAPEKSLSYADYSERKNRTIAGLRDENKHNTKKQDEPRIAKPYNRNGHPENERRIKAIQQKKAERTIQIQKEKEAKQRELNEQKLAIQLEQERKEAETEKKLQWEIRQVIKYSTVYSGHFPVWNGRYLGNFGTYYRLSYVFHSRAAYEEANAINVLCYLASGNEKLQTAHFRIDWNRREKAFLLKETKIPCKTPPDLIAQSGLSEDRFRELEIMLCKKMDARVITDLHIDLDLYYRSGNDHDSRSVELNFDDLDKAYKMKAVPDIEFTSAQEERNKMTPSLRYNILKRDNFRCVLCGAKVEDGVKLHVDHIIPVSRGGKTEIGNLRTLCDRCNLGKGNKYDPNGNN